MSRLVALGHGLRPQLAPSWPNFPEATRLRAANAIQCIEFESNRTSANMIQQRFRIPEYLRRGCAQKLGSIKTSNVFRAILGSLLEEDWTTPNIVELRFTQEQRLLGRSAGAPTFKAFRCAKEGLIGNIRRIAAVAELDADELSYLLGRVAKIKIA